MTTQIKAKWLSEPGTKAVFKMLNGAGHQVFLVGGCVRNALLDVPVSDIDFATSATPTDVISLAKRTGLRAIPTGIDHGTITVVVDDASFEITTFRRDVETDGRHATVAFTDDLLEDARRRDFTMNALYCDAQGHIHDPLSGLPDLLARRVRFIENADERIREDYLRILRFFRFHAQYGDPDQGVDPDALAAIAGNLDGLDNLATERVGAEIMKLLAAPDPAPALSIMQTSGVLMRILPGADASLVAPLVHLETQNDCVPNAIRRLAALGGEGQTERLKLSRKQTKRIEQLRNALEILMPVAEVSWRWGVLAGWDVALLRAAMMGQELDNEIKDLIENSAVAIFPVSAEDLMPALEGPALGAALKQLERHWIDSGFAMNKAALLSKLPD